VSLQYRRSSPSFTFDAGSVLPDRCSHCARAVSGHEHKGRSIVKTHPMPG
jgi:hypothetical protein